MRLAALGILVALTCAAKPFPEAPSSYVYNEGVLSAPDASALSQRLAAVERNTGHQFVVALFQSLDGESLDDYTNKLFRAWKIGRAKTDDGLLFTLFVQDRKWRVEVGYGLESSLTDLEAAEFGRAGVPAYRRGDFAAGVRVVVEGLAARLEGGPNVRPPRPPQPPLYALPQFWVFLILIAWALLGSLFGRRTIGRRSYYGGGWGGGGFGGGGFGGGGFGGGGFGGGGFSGGGGSSGGGGASGGW